MEKTLSPKVRELLLGYQRDEETDHRIYSRIARREKNSDNKAVLTRIADEEKEHSAIWRRYTGETVKADRWKVFLYTILSYLLGYTFVIKIMERAEVRTARDYETLIPEVPEARMIMEQEEKHEEHLQQMLDEERLHYVGAMVLGLNDALVELTGTIAGLTFALADTKVVAMAGIVTGVAATLSMAASNYLAERADGKPDAFKSCIYTGVAYLITVVLLVLPYLLLPSNMYFFALVFMLAIVIGIIYAFNFYIAVAKSEPFMPRFKEMAYISLGVAFISFVIGLLAKSLLGIDL